MILVEGPDGAGKSTLVRHLRDEFGLKVGERGVANRDKLYEVTRQDTYRALATEILADAPPLIWDRLFVSEFVYHDIAPGRPCEFSEYERHYILAVLNAIACPVIVCLPPFEIVLANAMAEHQMDGVKDNLHRIYHAYAEDDLPWPDNVVWYDYTQETDHMASLEAVEDEVAGHIEERKQRSSAWA